jgi:predicted outer membrane repeat protein
MVRALCATAVLLLCAAHASGTTWIVDVNGTGHYITIGGAVGAVSSGDTLLVRPGTYTGSLNRYIDFGGKELVVRSTDGPATTVIDCQDAGIAFYLHSGELPEATVEGFTITNGQGPNGAAFFIDSSSSCTIRNCVISNCEATSGNGGGIFCDDNSHVCVYDTTFRDNWAVTYGGGAMIWGGSAIFRGCLFEANHGQITGGGLFVFWQADVLIDSCSFVSNTAYYYGGGVMFNQATGTIEDCTFYNNTAGSNGAGIYCHQCSPTVIRDIVSHSNVVAGIACSETAADPQISNCDVFANAGGDSLCGTYWNNLFEDPLYCDASAADLTVCSDSPCLPAGNPWGVTMGGIGQGCGPCGTGATDERASWGLIKALYE